MRREIAHSLVLVLVIWFAFLFPQTPLVKYDLQITAILFIVFFLAKRFQRGGRLLESVIFTLIVFIIVNTTGGATSPFFFLLYFLLFATALLLEPVISITVTLACTVMFLLFLPEKSGTQPLLAIFSLVFLTPFALFMGQEYIKNEKLKRKSEKEKEDAFLFLSLMIKNQIKNIHSAVENFMGDHELHKIKKSAQDMEEMIEKFEKEE
ncbi:hypothetical protein HYT33_01440 [Candidatus Roizmanbacteria bacterium]|nr:hypothetical protein [Candidatus Roizmanbacteria bacterium]